MFDKFAKGIQHSGNGVGIRNKRKEKNKYYDTIFAVLNTYYVS